jgi:hypothetical protein
MTSYRYPRQKFDPRADMVFMRPITVAGHRYGPGDDLTPELRALIGPKLRAWWSARIIALKITPRIRATQPEAATPPLPPNPAPAPKPKVGRPRKNPVPQQ